MDGSACLNCGERGTGRFCPACGQARRTQPIPTVREWLGEVLDELLMVDRRLPRSLGRLFWPPGELTRSWWEGRRASFVSPFRLYLLFAVPFFFLASLRSDDGDLDFFEVVVAGVMYEFGDTVLVVQPDPIPPLPVELHGDSTARAEYRRQVEEKYTAMRARDEAIGERVSAGIRRVFDVLPIAVGLVMIPFLAIMLRIGTHEQTRFVAHLVFSLHLHTVVYAIAMLAWFVGLSPGWAAFVGGGIFLAVARRRILEERWAHVLAGAVAIPTLYVVVFVATYIGVTMGLGKLGGGWLFGG